MPPLYLQPQQTVMFDHAGDAVPYEPEVMHQCKIERSIPFVECGRNEAYEIPYKRGKVYMVQTGRYLNQHLREHASSLKTALPGHLAVHVNRSQCSPTFNDVKVFGRFKDKSLRKIAEAFHISERGEGSVSTASIAL